MDDLSDIDKAIFGDYEVAAIDPGKDDLIYATNGDTKIIEKEHETRGIIEKYETVTFRYSQNQRRKETKSKVFGKIIEDDKMQTRIQNETVKEIETKLSDYNSKSCIYNDVKEYIKAKNKTNSLLLNYYTKKLYRKFKWFGFINRQRSEANMLERFKKLFGNPDKTIVCIGDWAQKQHSKFKEPTKGKGFRKLFRNAGYKVFLVDEYHTSSKSFIDGRDNETFRKRENPRPWKTDVRKQHGLLRTTYVQDSESKCVLTNRDFNGSMNILKHAYNVLHNIPLPTWLMRKTTDEDTSQKKKIRNQLNFID